MGEAVLVGHERTDRLRQDRREHVDRVGGEVDGVAAFQRLLPHRRLGGDVVADVRDVDPQAVALFGAFDRDGVVEVLGVGGVGRPRRQLPEVAALFEFRLDVPLRVLCTGLGLLEHLVRELVADLELLEELLALVREVAGEVLVDPDGTLPLRGSGVRLLVAVSHTGG